MVRSKTTDKEAKSKPVKVAFKGFVECRLADHNRAKFELWREAHGVNDFWDDIHEKLMSNYKISFSYDSYNDAMTASLTCNNPDHPDAGWCLTARSDTIEEAIATLMFKDEVLLQHGWTENAQATISKSKWG